MEIKIRARTPCTEWHDGDYIDTFKNTTFLKDFVDYPEAIKWCTDNSNEEVTYEIAPEYDGSVDDPNVGFALFVLVLIVFAGFIFMAN